MPDVGDKLTGQTAIVMGENDVAPGRENFEDVRGRIQNRDAQDRRCRQSDSVDLGCRGAGRTARPRSFAGAVAWIAPGARDPSGSSFERAGIGVRAAPGGQRREGRVQAPAAPKTEAPAPEANKEKRPRQKRKRKKRPLPQRRKLPQPQQGRSNKKSFQRRQPTAAAPETAPQKNQPPEERDRGCVTQNLTNQTRPTGRGYKR